MKRVTFKIPVTAVSHHMAWAVIRQKVLDLEALDTSGPEGQPMPHLSCWKARSRRSYWEMCWAQRAPRGSAAPFGLFSGHLCLWSCPGLKNSVTECGCNVVQPQEGNLKRGTQTLTQDFLAKLPFSYFSVILTYFIIHCHFQFNIGWPDAPAWLKQSLSLIKCPLCICFFLAGFWSHRNLIKFSLSCY